MPMELYSSEAFVRDVVNAISKSEGKPLSIGVPGTRHRGVDRDYVFQLITEAKKAVEGHYGAAASVSAGKPAASRSEAIKTLMAKLDRKDAAAKALKNAPSRLKPAAKAKPRAAANTKPGAAASRGARGPAR